MVDYAAQLCRTGSVQTCGKTIHFRGAVGKLIMLPLHFPSISSSVSTSPPLLLHRNFIILTSIQRVFQDLPLAFVLNWKHLSRLCLAWARLGQLRLPMLTSLT